MQHLLVSAICVIATLTYGLGFPQGQAPAGSAIQQSKSTAQDDSDMYMEAMEQDTKESRVNDENPQQEAQNSFYPSYPPFRNPPLGHSRPFYYQQEGAYSQRPHSDFNNNHGYFDSPARFSGYKDDYHRQSSNSENYDLLGSGNFGVIRGGTFYNDNDGESSNYDDYNSYYQNGHGKPSYYFGGPPNPRPNRHEQFANFRDFADINVPSNPSYSQYVVVYVNKNGTKHVPDKIKNKPKNIIESLALLDLENSTADDAEDTTIVPEKKLSKSKRKLLKSLHAKKDVNSKKVLMPKETIKDLTEPLLAVN